MCWQALVSSFVITTLSTSVTDMLYNPPHPLVFMNQASQEVQ